MDAERKPADGFGLDERINNLSKNLSNEKKQRLLELLQEWQQNERRYDKRFTCRMPVDFSNRDRVYHEFIHDLSKGGAFIRTREAFGIGEKIFMTFTIPKQQVHFKLAGCVVRLEKTGIGVQFDHQLSGYQKDIIRRHA